MSWFKRIFRSEEKPKIETDGDKRVMAIMSIGDKGNLSDFETIKRAILTDPDKGVRFAGLKRIHNFKDAEGFESFLDELQSREDMKPFEPYRSMALMRLGRINEDEFN